MKKQFILPILALSLILPVGCQSLPGQGISMSRPSVSHAPVTLSAEVQGAFDNEPSLIGAPIRIEAQGSVVRLSGYVKTIRQSDMAAFLASKVNGVKTVENNLIVRK